MRNTAGFGLVETMLVLVVGGVLIAGALALGRSVSANLDAHEASEHVIELLDNIERAYGSSGSFQGVSNSSLIAGNLLPIGLEAQTGTQPSIGMAFGGQLDVVPSEIEGQAGRDLVLSISHVPQRICAGFVSKAGRYGFQSMTIDGQEVLDQGGRLVQREVAQACSDGSTVVFTVDRGHTQGPPASDSCVLPSPSTQTMTNPCPSGYVGSITHTRSADCPPGSGLPVWGVWSQTRNCVAQCKPATHNPQVRYSTPCPAGQIGTIEEQRVSVCPGAAGNPAWSDWVEVSNTCAAQCTAPADQIASENCPAGQVGTIVRRRSATCPGPSGVWHWNAWEEVSNTCV